LSDHAAQNLRTTSIGLSIRLLLRSMFGEPSNCARTHSVCARPATRSPPTS